MYSNKLTSLSGGGALSDLSLIVVLDIHGNEFTNLPPDIMCLVSLKVYVISIKLIVIVIYIFNYNMHHRNFTCKTTI